MKSKEQLYKSFNEIVNSINTYSDRLVEAMCNGDYSEECLCNEEIMYLENKKDVLEWVLK